MLDLLLSAKRLVTTGRRQVARKALPWTFACIERSRILYSERYGKTPASPRVFTGACDDKWRPLFD
jgi:hypothetical protein